MDYEESITATRAKQDDIIVLTTMSKELHAILAQNGKAPRLRSAFVVNVTSIAANCFGHRALAQPRLICLSEGKLAIEYAFFTPKLPGKCVWSFVVLANRRISFIPSTGFIESLVNLEFDAPNLTEVLMLQLHGGVLGYALVSQTG